MVALTFGRRVPGSVAVERPDLRQLAIAPVVRRHRQAGVVATLLDDARTSGRGLARAGVADERDAAVVAVQAVAVGVAPIPDVAAWHRVIHRGQFFAGVACEYGQVLGSGQDVASSVAVVSGVVVARGGACAQERAGSVLGARRGLDRHLRLPVAVEVTHRHLRVVCPAANVDS